MAGKPADKKVEAPERVWLHYPESMNRTSCCERDVEYVRCDHVPNTRQRAERVAAELDRNALLYASRGDRPLTQAELKQTIAIIAAEFEK